MTCLIDKKILIITFIITVLLCISYFTHLQSYNPKWINDYVKVFYLSLVLGIYFLGFSILYCIKYKFKLLFKKIQKCLDVALTPLVVSFAIMFSYTVCLTVFNFDSIFISVLNFYQYLFIMLAMLVAPCMMFGQTIWITSFMKNMVKPATVDHEYQ